MCRHSGGERRAENGASFFHPAEYFLSKEKWKFSAVLPLRWSWRMNRSAVSSAEAPTSSSGPKFFLKKNLIHLKKKVSNYFRWIPLSWLLIYRAAKRSEHNPIESFGGRPKTQFDFIGRKRKIQRFQVNFETFRPAISGSVFLSAFSRR